MTIELKIIIAIGIIITVFWNLSVITWTNTPNDDSLVQRELACVQGGGTPLYATAGMYLRCENTSIINK